MTGGFVVSVAACAAVAALVPEGTPRVVAMAAVAGTFAIWSRSPLAAAATALMTWLFTTGFLVNAAGELTFTRSDLVRLGVFGTAALVGLVAGALFRVVRARDERRSFVSLWRRGPIQVRDYVEQAVRLTSRT
ncbi:hypothetical protein ACFXJ8_20460 [Nonomuraea sp. NPDC059194]|uniref:hypothetical protein n=1 Tax=Nonomuraea sp. NPDC059194 TaxID=3346764 RepID=UPI0036C70B69